MVRRVVASSGSFTTSPGRGARPFSISSAPEGSWESCFIPACHSQEMTSDTANPSSAYRIAGARTLARGMVPWAERSSSQPSTVPGTVTAWGLK